ncbi:hypothetical protein AB0H43_13400 [Hamadaea sp. NPDC050747]|uniref:hypothetical protein n=1 Tax=Hamadaea sp. NPDC050747 TaxID=3155789 RepID=UPI0033C88CFD
MFDLSALRANPITAADTDATPPESMLDSLSGKVIAFAVQGVPSLRLPRDSQSLANLWKLLVTCSPNLTERHDAVWTTLSRATCRIPLTPDQHGGRRLALAAIVTTFDSTPVLAIVKICFAPLKSRHGTPAIVGASAIVVGEVDGMAEALEEIYREATPEAQAAVRKSGARAVWLGGSSMADATNPHWRKHVEALGAVLGLAVEIIVEPARHMRRVQTAWGSQAPPEYLLVWQAGARGSEELVHSFKKMRPDGEVIPLAEPDITNALLESRLALISLGLPDHMPAAEPNRTPPVPGDERFYIKTGGSKTGDILLQQPDCGHSRWGSDAKRRAPRALMGVERLEGVRPKNLYLCERCTKHRWRAKF